MHTTLVHGMTAGLGEIYASWISILSIAKIQREKGHRVTLIIDCSKSSYLKADAIPVFYDMHLLRSKYFHDIVLTDSKVNMRFNYVHNNGRWSMVTTDMEGLEPYFWLDAHGLSQNPRPDHLEYPAVTSTLVNKYIELSSFEFNNVHHIRLLDGWEREESTEKVAEFILPQIQDNDLILSNSKLVKDFIKQKTDKKVLFNNNPIEDTITNHFAGGTDNPTPVDLLFLKKLYAYMEMLQAAKGKHLYKYSVYRNQWSAFLFFAQLENTPHTVVDIPEEFFDEEWRNPAYKNDSKWLAEYSHFLHSFRQ